MTNFLIMALVLFAVGAGAGLLAGLFGVGGGIVLVPAFTWFMQNLGYDNAQLMQIAVATSLATIIVTSSRSVIAHNKKGAVDWQVLRSWAIPIAVGAVAAVLFARGIKSQTLMAIFAVLAMIIAFVMFFGVGRVKISDDMPKGVRMWVMAILTGFFSTLLGIGGGSISVPIMVMHGRPMHQAVGTAAGFGALIAVPSVIAFMLSKPPSENLPPFQIGYVNFGAFAIVVFATLLTAPLGARLAHQLDAKRLKRYFAIFIFIVALNMLRKAFFV